MNLPLFSYYLYFISCFWNAAYFTVEKGWLADFLRVTVGGGLIAVSVRQVDAEVFMPAGLFLYVYKQKDRMA